jgi:uncharacterized membrane protein
MGYEDNEEASTLALSRRIVGSVVLATLFCALAGIVVYAEMGQPAEPCGLMCQCRHEAGARWLMCGEKP